MKICIKTENIKEALKLISSSHSAGNKITILNDVLLETIGVDSAKMYFTDLNTSVITEFPCEVKEQGRSCINLQKLQAINSTAKDKIDIDINNNIAIIKGSGLYKIALQNVDDFPKILPCDFSNAKKIELTALQKAIKSVSYAVGENEHKYTLKGIYFGAGDVVATDGHRLVKVELDTEIQESILPIKPLLTILNIPSDKKDVYITQEGNRVAFKIDNTEIQATVIDGAFPLYKNAIPICMNKIMLNKQELLAGIKSVLIDRDKNKGHLCFTSNNNGRMEIKWISAEQGTEAVYEMDCIDGGAFKVSITVKITETLNVIEEGEIAIHFTEAMNDAYITTPIIVNGDKEDNKDIHVIMPMRMG